MIVMQSYTTLALLLLIAFGFSTTSAFTLTPASCTRHPSAQKTFVVPQNGPISFSFTASQLNGWLDQFTPQTKAAKEMPQSFGTVTIAPDPRVALLFLAAGAVLDVLPYLQWTLGPLVTALGVLFLVQTYRIKFMFTDDNQFQLISGKSDKNSEEDSADTSPQPGENIVVGGANRWPCDTIVNYDFFPGLDSPVGPILVYFKETQTPSDKWNEGPGKFANEEQAVAEGRVVPGQVHFFPAVCNVAQIEAEFAKRGCGKL